MGKSKINVNEDYFKITDFCMHTDIQSLVKAQWQGSNSNYIFKLKHLEKIERLF